MIYINRKDITVLQCIIFMTSSGHNASNPEAVSLPKMPFANSHFYRIQKTILYDVAFI
jgi:hypothetical protein